MLKVIYVVIVIVSIASTMHRVVFLLLFPF